MGGCRNQSAVDRRIKKCKTRMPERNVRKECKQAMCRCNPNAQKKKGTRFSSSPYILVRLAGIEPTTPWFVAKYSIQLSYSREGRYYSTSSLIFKASLSPNMHLGECIVRKLVDIVLISHNKYC